MMNSKQRKLLSDALEFSLKGVGKEWLWCVDPIDGTTNFASGLPVSPHSIDCFSKFGRT
jgi:fructose-1,6-bisphosphatase/inositol monophosphatase family enzyme